MMVVASHPDDEIVGPGVFLSEQRRPCVIVHVTDGAPRSGEDARDAGCESWEEYASLRRRELESALVCAGITAEVCSLECPDQQAAWRIASHAQHLAKLFDQHRCSIVLTHPYEGGHPDHDATAAAVHAGAQLAKNRPALREFASYHAGAGGMECECFLGDNTVYPALTDEQRAWKRSVLEQFRSQGRVLAQFPLRSEPLRAAPEYDFSRPAHSGRLYYDNFNWGVHGEEWRSLAYCAFRDLGISCVC